MAGSEISGRHVTKCDLYFSLATKHHAVVATSGDLHSNSQALLPCCARRRHRYSKAARVPAPIPCFRAHAHRVYTERERVLYALRVSRGRWAMRDSPEVHPNAQRIELMMRLPLQPIQLVFQPNQGGITSNGVKVAT